MPRGMDVAQQLWMTSCILLPYSGKPQQTDLSLALSAPSTHKRTQPSHRTCGCYLHLVLLEETRGRDGACGGWPWDRSEWLGQG